MRLWIDDAQRVDLNSPQHFPVLKDDEHYRYLQPEMALSAWAR